MEENKEPDLARWLRIIAEAPQIGLLDEYKDMLRKAAEILEANKRIERVVRDAVVDYNEMYPRAPNDDCEKELVERAGWANDWLKANGFEPEEFYYAKGKEPT